MRQTSPLLIGICAVLACTTLGSLGYVFFEAGSNDAAASQKAVAAKVAVIDLEKVAAELGRKDDMSQKLQVQKDDLDGQLKEFQSKLQSQVTAKENEIKRLGQQVTPQQKQELVGLLNTANKQLHIQKQKATVILAQQKNAMILQFRKEAIAVAKEVARSQGFDMVVAKHPDVVLSYDSSFDITDAVIEAMPATPPVPAPEQPKQEVASQNQQQPTISYVAQRGENSYR